jgi:putative transposase
MTCNASIRRGGESKQVDDRIWLVTFMHYDLGYFDDQTCRLEPIKNPFEPTALPMRSE